MKKGKFLNHVSIKYKLLLTVAAVLALSAFLILLVQSKASSMLVEQKLGEFIRTDQYNSGVSINNFVRDLNRKATVILNSRLLDSQFNGRTENFAITNPTYLNILSSKAIGGAVIISTGGVKGYYGFSPGSVELPVSHNDQRIANSDMYFDTGKVYTDTGGEKYLIFSKKGGTPSHPYTLAIYIKASGLYDIAFTKNELCSDCRLSSSDGLILVSDNHSEVGRKLSSVKKSDLPFLNCISSNLTIEHASGSSSISENINYGVLYRSKGINGNSILLTLLILTGSLIALSLLLSARVIKPLKTVIEGLSAYNGEDIEVLYMGDSGNEITELKETYDNMLWRINKLVEQTKADAEKQRALELTALQEQINPHFLYNTLDNIAWIARIKNQPDIEMLVVSLARFFRISLHKGDKYIFVSEEIELVRNFVNIQQKRFPEKIELKYNISKRVSEQKMLKILLQPFVENCLKHGFNGSSSSNCITINGFHGGDDGRDIIFEIIDNGVGFAVPENFISRERVHNDQLNGYGINNVDERIKLEYGSSYGVQIESTPGKGTKVTIRIQDLPEDKLNQTR